MNSKNRKTYFDVAATTPLDPQVANLMHDINISCFGNPSSIHQFGQKAHNIIGSRSFGEDKFKQWEQMRKNNPKKFKQEMKKHDSLVLFMKEKYDIQEPTDFETMFDLYEQKLKDDELMSRNLKK